jgi:hypothetical protein
MFLKKAKILKLYYTQGGIRIKCAEQYNFSLVQSSVKTNILEKVSLCLAASEGNTVSNQPFSWQSQFNHLMYKLLPHPFQAITEVQCINFVAMLVRAAKSLWEVKSLV